MVSRTGTKALVTAVISGCAATAAWAVNVTVRAVVPPVVVIHDGTKAKIVVKAGMIVADADELIGGSDLASVQLECPNGATQTLSAKFRAVVNGRAARSGCAIDLKSGTAVATALAATADRNTDNDASISGGPYAMTSHHTQFGLSLTPGAKANIDAFVVDGEAFISADKTPAPASLKEGQLFSSTTAKIARIPEQTFQRIATAYVQLDLAQLGRAVTAQVATALQSTWLAALQQPGNANARKALTDMHSSLGLTSSLVSKYQLAKANSSARRLGTPSPRDTVFQYPMDGEYRLSLCLPNHWCGTDTAIAWCQSKGYATATNWKPAYDIGDKTPVRRMGGRDVCNRGPCDGFTSITCQ
jgi:hypothetical protein